MYSCAFVGRSRTLSLNAASFAQMLDERRSQPSLWRDCATRHGIPMRAFRGTPHLALYEYPSAMLSQSVPSGRRLLLTSWKIGTSLFTYRSMVGSPNCPSQAPHFEHECVIARCPSATPVPFADTR